MLAGFGERPYRPSMRSCWLANHFPWAKRWLSEPHTSLPAVASRRSVMAREYYIVECRESREEIR